MERTEVIFCFRKSPEGGYEACALGHSIFTQAETPEELRVMIRDAIYCHFEADLSYRIIENPRSSA